MDDLVRDVLREVYRGFVETGHPSAPNEIAATLRAPQAEVEDALRRLADDHAIVLAPGTPYVWMANPFSAIPTAFVAESAGRRWWGNCIWDATGILAAIGASEGSVSTTCPDCGEPMRVELREGVLHGDGIAHYSIPAAKWWEDIGAT